MILKNILVTLFVSVAMSGFSQTNLPANSDSATHFASFGIFFDQDLLVNSFNLGEDRNYTMGAGFYYGSDKLRRSWITAPVRWLSKTFYAKINPMVESSDRRPFVYSLMLGNGSFTPDDLADYNVIPNDRPYANVTYLQENLSRISGGNPGETKFVRNSTSFAVGLLGTNISKVVQTEIHSWYNENDTKAPRTPRGWPHQVSNGGELTMLFARSSEKLLTTKNANSKQRGKWAAELKHGWKYTLGYYTGAEYNFNLRAGFLDALNWTYDINPLSNSNKGRDIAWSYNKQTKPEVYMVVSARPAFMLYNALLNGQFRKSDFTIDFYHTRHLLFQWDLGLGGRIPFGANAALDLRWRIISGRTAEFKLPGRDPRSHYWGGFDIIYTHYK
jgi:hypothetical protein